MAAFARRNHQLWLVGGAVRDRRLRLTGGDTDYATDALPDDIEAIGRAIGAQTISVGRRFGTVRLQSTHKRVEFLRARREARPEQESRGRQ